MHNPDIFYENPVILRGCPFPLGAVLSRDGVNFSILSRTAEAVILVLFETADPDSRFTEIIFDPEINKTGDIWHAWVRGLKKGQLYGYRMDGPYEPSKGLRFNKNKLLLDPYAKAVSGNFKWDLSDARGFDPESELQDLSFSQKDSAPGAPKCIVIENDYKCTGKSLMTSLSGTIVYELHVKGFTYHETSGVQHRGTFKGLTEKIPYLKELGVSAVELMPIHEFDEEENTKINPLTGERLKNYWGYSTFSFFAPKSRYSSSGKLGEQYSECREMIEEFHKAGIEVILDVVFNHTAELDHMGPTLCFRGIDNAIYYILKQDKRYYKNFSGCGNTFNCNHPIVREFILDCLKYWVIEMNVDGFRFDLASVLGRDIDGNILSNPPLIERIEEDPILRDIKIIAEAWDAAGAYQVGDFPGRWAEWNGKYRDDVRKFWRGDENTVGYFSTRLTGSADLYQHSQKSPLHSINFITCHDGFTLNDMVSYNEKRNEENGENNIDGENNNYSFNYGFEGSTSDPAIESIRNRQIRNFIATLFLSQGVPMLYAGDEFRRTQNGNNNAYCQDNEISWIDWSYLEKNRDLFRFCREMIRFRKEHPVLRRNSFFSGKTEKGFSSPDISWHGVKINKPDWNINSHMIACVLNGEFAGNGNGFRDNDIYMSFNASKTGFNIEVPDAPSGGKWYAAIDTSKSSPEDIPEKGKEILLNGRGYFIGPQSVLVMISRN
ncbi:MAG: glycogen debranching protein GlgX [Spirochaetes bacterium]|nr:glycogen debranching protein GlgX [Spirochaetota bacterium]